MTTVISQGNLDAQFTNTDAGLACIPVPFSLILRRISFNFTLL
ncbi:hypothetical protein LEP1GSC040_2202 [Leptospira santarosai str. 2000030832]|nr:hypothetical protein LEP1GSC040_2202 [Leptospira santarosai str. 2000030832]